MKALLMYRDQDFDLKRPLPPQEAALVQDLELATLFSAMAGGDKFLLEVARKAVLTSLRSPDAIRYRQQILADCLRQPAVVREMYQIAVAAIEAERKVYYGIYRRMPSAVLSRSVEVLRLFVPELQKLRALADQYSGQFASAGFTTLFVMLQRELDDTYFARIQAHLRDLKFRSGALISAGLGKGNKGTGYVLHRTPERKRSWLSLLFGKTEPEFTYRIADRDEGGIRALGELRDRGINPVANALAQSVDHILAFFTMLRTELAFYVGCMNLQEQLAAKGAGTCLPVPVERGRRTCTCAGLYDVCLALRLEGRVVGNDVQAEGKELLIITGANRGGKSTFLRSLGLAQLMMQCGMFVAAALYSADVCIGLFTHFKREEDATMSSGKLDEELSRMSAIVEHLTADCLVLLNESFAATNEREGSEIARQITCALLERRVKVCFVTHLHEFARGMYERHLPNAMCLRAERKEDGERTYKVVEGKPLQTSYGEDLYRRIFGVASNAVSD